MALTRRALIVTNPGESGDENYCRGVYVDADNYKRLLVSAEGGAWKSDEIVYRDRPGAFELYLMLEMAKDYDYTFFAYAGHGFYSSARQDRILVLKKGEEVPTKSLKGGTRRTFIFDCCNEVHREYSTALNMMKALEAAAQNRRATPATCRVLFDAALLASTRGEVRLYSCGMNETATDDDERGGRYTSNLIECVGEWVKAQSKQYMTSEYYSVIAAHTCATAKTIALSQGQQNPQAQKEMTGPYFPIAVFS